MPSVKGPSPDPNIPLPYNTALRDFRNLLRLIGIDPNGYGEHPGRSGGTTAAASRGATLDDLMIQGLWRSESMPQLYTDNAKMNKRRFARRLAAS